MTPVVSDELRRELAARYCRNKGVAISFLDNGPGEAVFLHFRAGGKARLICIQHRRKHKRSLSGLKKMVRQVERAGWLDDYGKFLADQEARMMKLFPPRKP